MKLKYLIAIGMLFICTVNAVEGKPVKIPLAKVIGQKSKQLILKNKLKIYLISNPNTKISSASLSMILGQGEAPKGFEGLPHVLEHALFLGSRNYPEEEEWSKFFKSRGWSNGSTRPDISRYHFQIDSASFPDGLKRLHDLLLNPLLTDKGFKKALQDVENEYHDKNGSWRKLLSVMRENINPTHPLAVFGTGNYNSLGKYNNVMRKNLLKLYHQFYHPENMTLVVYHSAPLDQLEKLVQQTFEETPSKFTYLRGTPPPLLLSKQAGNIVKVSTSSKKSSLDMRFEIPPRTNNINSILPEYLGEYLNDTVGKNLKSKGLISNLSLAFQGDMYTGLLDIYVELTPDGNNNYKEIINLILVSLNKFQSDIHNANTQEKYCENLKANHEKKVQEIGDWLSDISDQMTRWSTSKYVEINYCPVNISRESIELLTKYLTRDNFQVFHVTDKEFLPNGESKFYNVPFISQKFEL
jgi:secreted Zn-dependent insulinase-like peptidase